MEEKNKDKDFLNHPNEGKISSGYEENLSREKEDGIQEISEAEIGQSTNSDVGYSESNDTAKEITELHHKQKDEIHSQEIPAYRIEQSLKVDKKPKLSKVFWKRLVSNVSIAVISSLLTVSLFNHFQGSALENSIESKVSSNQKENTTPVNSSFISTESSTIADIAENLAPSIVGVVNLRQVQTGFNFQSQNVQSGSGSGVIYKKDNDAAYIITNNHVIEGASEVEVSLYNGETAKAEIVGADALTDLAVLKIDANSVDNIAPFGNSSALRPGDEVIAIGNPLGLEFSRTVTQGIISATERNITVSTSAGDWELTVLQTDAAINPGNSGGALINSRGEVIGINSLKISEEGVEGLGFAIPSNDVVPIAEELIEHGAIKRAYLGVQLYDVDDIAQFYRQSLFGSLSEGVVIVAIEDNSPAAKAGLVANDVIVSIDGNQVNNSGELKQYLYKNVKPGEKIEVEYYRNGEKHKASVTTEGN